MTYEHLSSNVTQIESLVNNAHDYAEAEQQARTLLSEASLPSYPELHLRTLLILSDSLLRRGYAKESMLFSEEACKLALRTQQKELLSRAYTNIAVSYQDQSEFAKALEYFQHVLELYRQSENAKLLAGTLHNIGYLYFQTGDYTTALEYYEKALKLNQEFENRPWLAINLSGIATVYIELGDSTQGINYCNMALAINEELGSKEGIAKNLSNLGVLHLIIGNHSSALDFTLRALALHEELEHETSIARSLCNCGVIYYELHEYSKALEYNRQALSINKKLNAMKEVALNMSNIGGIFADPRYEAFDAQQAEQLLTEAMVICEDVGAKRYYCEVLKTLSQLYRTQERWKEADTAFQKYHSLHEEVQSNDAKQAAANLDRRRLAAEREKEIEIERTRASAEKSILDNILPKEITTRLIAGESPIADHFDCVSVLFMDIVDFTPLSSRISAQQLVHLLNAIFSAADAVMRKFGMEKIKTIGDAYMAVAGAPIVQEDHAQRAAQAALRLLEVMENLVVTFPDTYGDRSWIKSIPEIKVRIGLHCGPAAAGVVGENKFLYDLWGDAVNTAARMESHGEEGRIHVSDEFVMALSASVIPAKAGIHFRERGEMEIKGKGFMRTFFMEKT